MMSRIAFIAGAGLVLMTAQSGAIAGEKPARAGTPLPYKVVERLSAFDMIDGMGTNVHISYQLGGKNPHNLPNRNGELELISALQYLGIHHIRNQGLDDDPTASSGTAYPHAPTDFENFLTIRKAIPRLKLNYLVNADGPPRWGEGSRKDPIIHLKRLAEIGALASIEAPNEPNNQPTFSPKNERYPQDLSAYDRIWKDWGDALQALKKSDPAFAAIPILPPTLAAHGPNGPDGVEAHHFQAGLSDHRTRYDYMNIHTYSARGGVNLGDPMGSIAEGMPPNFAAFQVSISNWGRYALPGRGTIITESGANGAKIAPVGHYPVSEQAHGLAIVNNYFWGAYYGARRHYQYQIVDDSTDLDDPHAERWGFYRGDWSPKPAADYVHRFTKVLADDRPSDRAKIPPFSIKGKNPETWGAVMAFSKSDGSYVIAANNILRWWDHTTGESVTPAPEAWQITLDKVSDYTITDVKTGEIIGPNNGKTIDIAVRGYPVMVHVKPR